MDYLHKGKLQELVPEKDFVVEALDNTVLPAEDREAKVAFQRKVSKLQGEINSYSRIISEVNEKIRYIKEANKLVEKPIDELSEIIRNVELKTKEINTLFYGDNVKSRLDIQQIPTPSSRIGSLGYEQKYYKA